MDQKLQQACVEATTNAALLLDKLNRSKPMQDLANQYYETLIESRESLLENFLMANRRGGKPGIRAALKEEIRHVDKQILELITTVGGYCPIVEGRSEAINAHYMQEPVTISDAAKMLQRAKEIYSTIGAGEWACGASLPAIYHWVISNGYTLRKDEHGNLNDAAKAAIGAIDSALCLVQRYLDLPRLPFDDIEQMEGFGNNGRIRTINALEHYLNSLAPHEQA